MRNLIWSELCNLKFKEFSLEILVDKYQRWDRRINIFLVIISSGSIAAWTMWDDKPLIWGGIIVFSQILTVIKPYIPYFKYVQELKLKNLQVRLLNVEFERLWYLFNNNKLDNEKASNLYFDLKKEATGILEFKEEIIFKVNKRVKRDANKNMRIFLKSKYGIIININ